MAKICAKCKKNVYPLEELKCLDKIWHKSCFRCTTCNMLLNMKNYKGHDKLPYCVAHYPKTKATSVAMTPEISRITNNTKLQSQVHYHEDFEKKIKGSKIEVTDDPETARVLKVNAMISQTNYKSNKPQPPLSKPRVMERVKAQDQPSPMSARCVTNSVVYTSDGSKAVGGSRTQGGRKVGSIADYDPVNNQYGSISHAPQGALRTPHKGGVVEKGVIEKHVNGGKNGEMEKSKRANEDGVEGGVGMLIRRVEEEEEEERGIKVREEEKKREKEEEEEERKTEQRKEDEKRRVEEEEERRVKDEERRKKEEQEQKEEKRRVKEKEEKERKMKEEEEEEKMREKEEKRKRLEEEERRENEEAEMMKMVEERRKKEEEERKEKEEEERRKKEEERRKEEGGMKENGYLEQRQGLKPDLLPMERHSQEELNQQQQQRYLEQQQLEQQQLEQQQLEQQQLEQQQLEQQQLEQQQLEQQQLEQQQLEQQQLLEEQKKLQQQQQLYEAAVEQQQQQHGEEGDDDDEVREEQQPVVIDDDEIATTPLPGVWQALYDFTAQDDDEVSFVEDDVITQVERIDDGWFLGTVERTKLRGMLPSNYVEMRQ